MEYNLSLKAALPDLPSVAQLNILVVGDVMLDRYWHGPVDRVSPEAPVPVVSVQQTEHRPGGDSPAGSG